MLNGSRWVITRQNPYLSLSDLFVNDFCCPVPRPLPRPIGQWPHLDAQRLFAQSRPISCFSLAHSIPSESYAALPLARLFLLISTPFFYGRSLAANNNCQQRAACSLSVFTLRHTNMYARMRTCMYVNLFSGHTVVLVREFVAAYLILTYLSFLCVMAK